MFGAATFWARRLAGQALPITPPADPAVAPPAEPADAPLVQQPNVGLPPPLCAEAGGADAGRAPSPLRRSPRRPPPQPTHGRVPLLRPEGLAVQPPGGADADDAPRPRLPALRSLAALRASEECGLAEQLGALHIPTGPWPTDEEAKEDISHWARDRAAGGGGFGVSWGNSRAAVAGRRSARGRLHTLVCHNHLKGKCTWSVTLEECHEGWAIRSFHPHDGEDSGHNHALIHTAVEARARCSMRDIPAALIEQGKVLVSHGVSNAQVYRVLKGIVEKEGGEALFTVHDVYHACGSGRLDATNLTEMLCKREMDEGLFQRTTTDDSGALTTVFFAMKGAMEIYANEPDRQVVEIDHKVRGALRTHACVSTTTSLLTRSCLFSARHEQARAQDDAVGHGGRRRPDESVGMQPHDG